LFQKSSHSSKKAAFKKRPNLRVQPAAFSKHNLALFIKMSSIGCRTDQPCQSPSVNYIVNILTVKSAGFTCVSFPTMFSLYFWQPRSAKTVKLVFSSSKTLSKEQLKYIGKETTGKTCNYLQSRICLKTFGSLLLTTEV